MGAPNSDGSSLFCRQCGQALEQGLRFCPSCGQRVLATGHGECQDSRITEDGRPTDYGERQELRNSEAIAPLRPLASHDDFVDPRESRVSYIGFGAGAVLLAAAALLAVFFALGILPPKAVSSSSAPLVQIPSTQVTLTEASAVDTGEASTDAGLTSTSTSSAPSKAESSKSVASNKDDKNKREQKDKVSAAQYPPVFSDAVASTTLAPDQYVSYYGAMNAIDHNLTSAWNEGAKGPGKGEWLRLQAPSEQRVSGVRIVAGYPKNEAVYKNNNRPKEITVELSDGYKMKTTLDDEFGGWQRVEFDEAHATSFVKLTINSVYSGTTYDDTSFAEVEAF